AVDSQRLGGQSAGPSRTAGAEAPPETVSVVDKTSKGSQSGFAQSRLELRDVPFVSVLFSRRGEKTGVREREKTGVSSLFSEKREKPGSVLFSRRKPVSFSFLAGNVRRGRKPVSGLFPRGECPRKRLIRLRFFRLLVLTNDGLTTG